MNQREFTEFEGLTYFSAVLRAGLLLHPAIGQGPAALDGRWLRYDAGYCLTTQRAEVLRTIAAHLAAQDGGGSSLAADYRACLERAVLPAIGRYVRVRQ